jgi:hypothetical protein
MLTRLILGVVVAVAITLVCLLVGGILIKLNVSVAVTVGNFLKTYSAVIGILAGLWYAFSSYFPRPNK